MPGQREAALVCAGRVHFQWRHSLLYTLKKTYRRCDDGEINQSPAITEEANSQSVPRLDDDSH